MFGEAISSKSAYMMYLENAFHENVDKVFLNEEVNAKLTTQDVIHPRITDLERIC